MKTLLLHSANFDRLSEKLDTFRSQLRVVVMNDDGRFREPYSGDDVAAVEPDIVFGSTDAFFSKSARVFAQTVMSSPNLDWFQSTAAGIEHPVLAAIGKVARHYTTNHRQAEAISEWVVWQAFDYLRRGPEHRRQAQNGEWQRLTVREMSGSRWLIFGYGAIGQAVGQRVTALGGRVTGVRRAGGSAPGASLLVKPDHASEHFCSSDVVLLALPHTDETESMADAAFFSAMKRDTLFMNVGRGALVVEDALLAGLEAGRPAYATLDVAREEPLPAASPLWRHPKISMTPHNSSHTAGTKVRADETFIDNLARYLAGAPLHNLMAREAFD